MPSIDILPPEEENHSPPPNPLPQLLHTPSGLALLELQGTLNFPSNTISEPSSKRPRLDQDHATVADDPSSTKVGTLVFPLYDATRPDDESWMRKVYFYVGRHQRMTGEVKRLAKPIAVLRRASTDAEGNGGRGGGLDGLVSGNGKGEALRVVEVVRYKILFTSRPEPVGSEDGGGGGG